LARIRFQPIARARVIDYHQLVCTKEARGYGRIGPSRVANRTAGLFKTSDGSTRRKRSGGWKGNTV